MKIKQFLTKLALTVILTTLTWRIIVVSMERYSFGLWLAALAGTLLAAFLGEAIKSINGREIFWSTLSLRDKFLAVAVFVIIITFALLPLVLDMSWIFLVLFVVLGYFVAWLVAKMFGSEALQKIFFR
jgi:hypothetical protein